MNYNTYKEGKVQSTLVIPKELWEAINSYCKANGIKKNYLIVKILSEFFSNK